MRVFETGSTDTDPRGVATWGLNRPEKHNALAALMIQEIAQAADQLGADAAVRVVVLKAEGKSFCAGGDLGWMQDQMAADPQTRAREAKALAMMLNALNTLPKPLIGCLEGNAFGGGVGLASVRDVALGIERLKMGLTDVRLGLTPATLCPPVIACMGGTTARRADRGGGVAGGEGGGWGID